MQRKHMLKRKDFLDRSIETDLKDIQSLYRILDGEIPKELVQQAEQILKTKRKELIKLERALSEE